MPRLAGASLVMLFILGAGAWGVYALKDDVIKAVEALPQAAKRAREMVLTQLGSSAGAIQEAADELGKGAGTEASMGSGGGESTGTSGEGELPGGVVA